MLDLLMLKEKLGFSNYLTCNFLKLKFQRIGENLKRLTYSSSHEFHCLPKRRHQNNTEIQSLIKRCILLIRYGLQIEYLQKTKNKKKLYMGCKQTLQSGLRKFKKESLLLKSDERLMIQIIQKPCTEA